ncbi:MAG: T9SS type A sorting domain-containing protein [Thaumarchaeota archaeon]|nr:T9SS type A sorting domain-containing protein [Nitrososphaerota archaeon]
MPFNTDIIWAGTEIGIFESLDGGVSWNIREDFPSVSIWSMKIVDDQVVIGTHGRGIWTAAISELVPSTLSVISFDYSGYGNGSVNVKLPAVYDKVEVLINNESKVVDMNPSEGEVSYDITGFKSFDEATIKVIGTFNGVPYPASFQTESIDVTPSIINSSSTFDGEVSNISIELENNEPFDKVEVLFNDNVVYTDEQVLTEGDASRIIEFDYDEQTRNTVDLKSYINGFSYKTSLQEVLVTSNKDLITNGTKIYPNPAVNQLTVENDGNSLRRVQIFTSSGKLMKSFELNNNSITSVLNISDLKEGMYLVQLTDKNGAIKTKRIVKQ